MKKLLSAINSQVKLLFFIALFFVSFVAAQAQVVISSAKTSPHVNHAKAKHAHKHPKKNKRINHGRAIMHHSDNDQQLQKIKAAKNKQKHQ